MRLNVDLAGQDDAIDQTVLTLLLETSGGVWAIRDLELEIGDVIAVTDSVARLERCGLAHLSGRLVIASRAAQRAAELTP